jgi:predicted nucleic acid-binding protein
VIVVDTNVISELMRGEPHPGVLAWVSAQPRALLYTTHINQAEILYGIAALPEGRRRTALAAVAMAMFTEDFAGRILPFEAGAAACYPEIVLARRQAGNPIEKFDALIAVPLAPDAALPDTNWRRTVEVLVRSARRFLLLQVKLSLDCFSDVFQDTFPTSV